MTRKYALPARRFLLGAYLLAIAYAELHRWADYPPVLPDLPHEMMVGEAVYHGIHHEMATSIMPLSGLWVAFLNNSLSPPVQRAAETAVALFGLLLVFLLARALSSTLLAAAAAAAASVMGLLHSVSAGEDRLYVLAVLLVANLLARRTRRPSRVREALLGLGIGVSLLLRTALLFLPLALAAGDMTAMKRASWRRRIAAVWPLLLASYILLVPWVRMNSALHGRPKIFEESRVHFNLAAGALGWTTNVDGVDFLDDMAESGGGFYRWAAGEYFGHPFRSAAAVSRRLWFAFRLQPILFLLAGVGLWRHRARTGARQAGLLAAYFFLIHCLMAVESSYFGHIWPVMAAFAASAFTSSAPPAERKPVALWFCYALFIAAAGATVCYVVAYPRRALANGTDVNRALESSPRDPWLWAQRGRQHLASGRPDLAAADFSRAHALQPRLDRAFDYAWARLAQGGPGSDVIARLEFNVSTLRAKEFFLRAVNDMVNGRSAEARRHFIAANEVGLSGCRFPDLPSERERAAVDGICARTLSQSMMQILFAWPLGERAAVYETFAELAGGATELRIPALDLAARAGDRAMIRRVLKRLDTASLERLIDSEFDDRSGEAATRILDEVPASETARFSARIWLRAVSYGRDSDRWDDAARLLVRAREAGADMTEAHAAYLPRTGRLTRLKEYLAVYGDDDAAREEYEYLASRSR